MVLVLGLGFKKWINNQIPQVLFRPLQLAKEVSVAHIRSSGRELLRSPPKHVHMHSNKDILITGAFLDKIFKGFIYIVQNDGSRAGDCNSKNPIYCKKIWLKRL